MDEAPFTEDLDLDAVATREELAALLRTVRLRADKPSLRTLAARTRYDTTPLSKTAVSEMLNGTRLPRKAVMISFLRACGLPDTHTEQWRRAWERIATSEDGGPGHWADSRPSRGLPSVQTVHVQYPDDHAQGPSDGHYMRADGELRQAARVNLAFESGSEFKESLNRKYETRSPMYCRRELGALLRGLRVERGLTADQVAERLLCSSSKVSRMETAGSASTRDIRDLCDLYGITVREEREHLAYLVRQGKRQSSWHSYGVPYSNYVELEGDAVSIENFHCTVIHGILQTEDYAFAVHERALPKIEEKVIRERVEERLRRRRLLTRESPPHYHAIMDEAALHRIFGSPEVMRQQLDWLAEAAELPNVIIQVVPYAAGAHPALESCFSILTFDGVLSPFVHVEGLVGRISLERPDDIERYRDVFRALENMALEPNESIALITGISKDFESHSRLCPGRPGR